MNTTPEQDRANGLKAIQYFHDYSRANFPLKYTISFEELKNIIDTRGKASIAGLGLGISLTDASDSKVREAMENLAREAQGDIPRSNNAFNMALSDRLQEIDFDAISEISTATAKDLLKESQNIGDKVITGVQGAFDLVGGAKIAIPLILVGYLGIRAYASGKKKPVKR
jgi:hypothetical protein